MFVVTCRGIQTWPWPAGPTSLPDLHPSSARTDAPVGQFRVSMPNAQCQWVEWRVFFSKTWATRPDGGYIKIRRNQAQIRGDLASSQPYLVRFSQILPFPSYFNDFGADFSDFGTDLMSFNIFWRWFADSGDDFATPAMILQLQRRPDLHLNRPDPHPNPKPTWLINAGGWFRVTLLSTRRQRVGFGLGWKSTWPDPLTPLMVILSYRFSVVCNL